MIVPRRLTGDPEGIKRFIDSFDVSQIPGLQDAWFLTKLAHWTIRLTEVFRSSCSTVTVRDQLEVHSIDPKQTLAMEPWTTAD